MKSIDSYLPSSDAFLIRGGGSIHYSKSPGVPKTTFGNRCARGWWLEEFAVDESDPYSYLITYRLPYEPNVNPAEFYDMAQRVAPLDRMFRLYVTGLREERSQANRSVLAHESSECELYLGA